ncbi:hypothetical protein CGK40_24695 [Vibrio parahaemolyticus]|uniref:hypothetical protein n=1 Tax=Vibrio parahaemolyticus TaxID=670 RepID=UPI00111CAA4E|nr:hypothetical protein [Vibrio parahaemolyticus]TNZ86138.1 hypothetical protein CGK40_24695 [Vibrio parahaemolyticus]
MTEMVNLPVQLTVEEEQELQAFEEQEYQMTLISGLGPSGVTETNDELHAFAGKVVAKAKKHFSRNQYNAAYGAFVMMDTKCCLVICSVTTNHYVCRLERNREKTNRQKKALASGVAKARINRNSVVTRIVKHKNMTVINQVKA